VLAYYFSDSRPFPQLLNSYFAFPKDFVFPKVYSEYGTIFSRIEIVASNNDSKTSPLITEVLSGQLRSTRLIQCISSVNCSLAAMPLANSAKFSCTGISPRSPEADAKTLGGAGRDVNAAS
jgi:hypothetical protein